MLVLFSLWAESGLIWMETILKKGFICTYKRSSLQKSNNVEPRTQNVYYLKWIEINKEKRQNYNFINETT